MRKLVKEEEYAKLARKLRRLHPYDISELLQKFNKSLRDKILLNLPNDMLIELIPEFPEEMQSEFVEILSPQMAANLLASISPDDMADVLGDLALDTRKKIVGYFSKEKVREASSLLKHPRDTAGGLMTTEVVSLNKDMLVGKAMEYVRKEAEEYETVYYIYVVDDDGKLVGVLS
ncbi:MAG: magnesium transporter MgtE N-terminal domain-containing protein, partial [Candidatus Hydrothermarchaeaceae archaeon]